MKNIQVLRVDIAAPSRMRTVGRLAWNSKERRSYFQYDAAFLAEPLPVSPFRLPNRPGAEPAPHVPFEGLHGLFNDSLPDGWGRLLLDRSLSRRNVDHRLLTPVDRLAFVGTRGMGALIYLPEHESEGTGGDHRDLDWFAEQSDLVLSDVSVLEIDVLRGAQGGSAGARPKINVGIGPDDEVTPDYGLALPEGYERWIVKFRGADDPKEIGAEEFAYLLMAETAGINVPEGRLIVTRKGGRYFATKRFDRVGGERIHVQTASALVEADHRMPTLDYEMLHRITHVLTRDVRCVAEIFRRMTFNVFAHNRDDHAKNHAFRMAPDGEWTTTPAYDMTFSNGPGGEHNLAIAGEGRRPTEGHLLEVAKRANLDARHARTVVEEVASAISRWMDFADEAGVPKDRAQEIDAVINPGLGPRPKI